MTLQYEKDSAYHILIQIFIYCKYQNLLNLECAMSLIYNFFGRRIV